MDKDAKAPEIEKMSEVDQHPGVHAKSSPEEQDVLQELYGKPDENGIYGRPVDRDEEVG